ncbi:MAG: terpene synthase family protein [Chloroflexota bacterium]
MTTSNWQARLFFEYENLLNESSNKFKLNDLLILSQDTIGFKPYATATTVERQVENFARNHNIWIEDRAVDYNTMTAYLHPSTVDNQRLYLLGGYYAILFFIDDVIGNEFRSNMTLDEQDKADQEMGIVMSFIETGKKSQQHSRLLAPIIEILNGFSILAPSEWLDYFLQFTKQHLTLAVDDLNSESLGYITPEQYVEMRNHVSGMYPAILMMEFANDSYLPRSVLNNMGLLNDIERLEYLCAAIGGLVNDFFSFEKEVLDAQSDFNIIPIMMRHEQLSLEESIYIAANYTNSLYCEYKQLAMDIRKKVQLYKWGSTVTKYLDAMNDCNQAVWVWQIDTNRYDRETSIFSELQGIAPNYHELERLQYLS